ncbi:MAG: hypothetical protein O0V67_07305 [Methanocorpusculum sp.]|nr:hypothetical protein [Methanocorpusculum sp.]
MTVDVLGTKYEIIESDRISDNNLDNNDGYCDFSTKKIVIDTFKNTPGSMEDLEKYRRQVIRHELIHAFLFESGLDASSWGKNEEIVDWIAIQFLKLFDAFEKADAL